MNDQVTTIIIPDERPQSWNKTYAGQHWGRRRDEVARVRLALRAQIDPDQCEPYSAPVDVEITAFFDARPLDADNIPAKLYVDALKGWLLDDDNPRCVHSVRTVTEIDAHWPRVEIRITPCNVFVAPDRALQVLAALGHPPLAWD